MLAAACFKNDDVSAGVIEDDETKCNPQFKKFLESTEFTGRSNMEEPHKDFATKFLTLPAVLKGLKSYACKSEDEVKTERKRMKALVGASLIRPTKCPTTHQS